MDYTEKFMTPVFGASDKESVNKKFTYLGKVAIKEGVPMRYESDAAPEIYFIDYPSTSIKYYHGCEEVKNVRVTIEILD